METSFCCYLVTKLCPTPLQPHRLQPARLLSPWDFLGKNTGVGCNFLFQGIVPIQGSKPHLLHWQAGSLPGSHWGWQFSTFEDKETIFSFHLFYSFILNQKWSDLTEAEDIKKRGQEYTEELHKKDLHNPDNHDGVIIHLEPDILEWQVRWALERITTNKASGGDGIPVELFQILKDDAVRVLHSICQQIWKT